MTTKYGYSTDIKLLSKVKGETIEELRSWCYSRIPDMTSDFSRYAKGRYRLWLFHEIDLRDGKVSRGYFEDRIWQFCQQVYPGCNVGLLTFGGKTPDVTSTGLISPHRDHSYAKAIARTVNLGSCVFGYGDDYHQQYQLNDGDIIEFNCKVLHSVQTILSAERFSINLWQLNENKGYFPVR